MNNYALSGHILLFRVVVGWARRGGVVGEVGDKAISAFN